MDIYDFLRDVNLQLDKVPAEMQSKLIAATLMPLFDHLWEHGVDLSLRLVLAPLVGRHGHFNAAIQCLLTKTESVLMRLRSVLEYMRDDMPHLTVAVFASKQFQQLENEIRKRQKLPIAEDYSELGPYYVQLMKDRRFPDSHKWWDYEIYRQRRIANAILVSDYRVTTESLSYYIREIRLIGLGNLKVCYYIREIRLIGLGNLKSPSLAAERRALLRRLMDAMEQVARMLVEMRLRDRDKTAPRKGVRPAAEIIAHQRRLDADLLPLD